MNNISTLTHSTAFEVRYPPLAEGRELAFPCDDGGHVDMNRLSKRALSDYLYARALVGRMFGLPQVRSVQ